MIAIDLSPLVLDPRRGVARALQSLLAGLAALPRQDLRIEGFAPRSADPTSWPSAIAGLAQVHVLGPERPRPAAWRAALSAAIAERGARVLLSPWVRFPRTQVPVVAWVHEVPFVRHGALEGRVRTLRHRRALARAVEIAAALVTPSQAVLADLRELHPACSARASAVPHGFDPWEWRVRAGMDVEFPVARGTLTVPVELAGTALGVPAPEAEPGGQVLLIGTGHRAGGARKKGLDVFLQAFGDGPIADLDPVIVGASPDIPQGVLSFPEADDYFVGLLLRSTRVLAVPSRSEGFGFPMLEAFAAGVPVVASAAGALPEVSGGAARLVPPGDADALREEVARVATDEDLRARMIKDGRKRAQEFPVAAMARGWLRVLTQAGGIPWRG